MVDHAKRIRPEPVTLTDAGKKTLDQIPLPELEKYMNGRRRRELLGAIDSVGNSNEHDPHSLNLIVTLDPAVLAGQSDQKEYVVHLANQLEDMASRATSHTSSVYLGPNIDQLTIKFPIDPNQSADPAAWLRDAVREGIHNGREQLNKQKKSTMLG